MFAGTGGRSASHQGHRFPTLDRRAIRSKLLDSLRCLSPSPSLEVVSMEERPLIPTVQCLPLCAKIRQIMLTEGSIREGSIVPAAASSDVGEDRRVREEEEASLLDSVVVWCEVPVANLWPTPIHAF